MARVLVALIVGAAMGAAVFLFLREDAPALSVSTPIQNAPQAPAAEPAAPRAFVSATHPGLVVTVKRNGSGERQVRLELSRARRSISSERIVWEAAGSEFTDAEGRADFPARAGHYYLVAAATDGTRQSNRSM